MSTNGVIFVILFHQLCHAMELVCCFHFFNMQMYIAIFVTDLGSLSPLPFVQTEIFPIHLPWPPNIY